MRKAFREGQSYMNGGNCIPNDNNALNEDEYIQSLQQKEVYLEVEDKPKSQSGLQNADEYHVWQLKVTDNKVYEL